MIKKAADMSANELAAYIEHIILYPEFTQDEIRGYIQEAVDFGCRAVCVTPTALDIARELCAGSHTGISVVCNLTAGSDSALALLLRIEKIIQDGDVVDLEIAIDCGLLKGGRVGELGYDIKAIADLCHKHGTLLKAILDTDSLGFDQIADATEFLCDSGVDFVASSSGALLTQSKEKELTTEAIKLMIDAAQGRCRVKSFAHTKQHLLQLIDIGVDRVGIDCRTTSTILCIL